MIQRGKIIFKNPITNDELSSGLNSGEIAIAFTEDGILKMSNGGEEAKPIDTVADEIETFIKTMNTSTIFQPIIEDYIETYMTQSSKVELNNNSNIVSLKGNNLKIIKGGLNITNNTELEDIILPELIEIKNNMVFIDNNKIESLSFVKLKYVYENIIIEENSNLSIFNLPDLEQLNDLDINNNESLITINIPKILKLENVSISSNDLLETISLNLTKADNLLLRNNKLSNINLSGLTSSNLIIDDCKHLQLVDVSNFETGYFTFINNDNLTNSQNYNLSLLKLKANLPISITNNKMLENIEIGLNVNQNNIITSDINISNNIDLENVILYNYATVSNISFSNNINLNNINLSNIKNSIIEITNCPQCNILFPNSFFSIEATNSLSGSMIIASASYGGISLSNSNSVSISSNSISQLIKLNIDSCNLMTSISFPNLTTISEQFVISNLPLLNSINISNLTSVNSNIFISNCPNSSISLSSIITATYDMFFNNVGILSISNLANSKGLTINNSTNSILNLSNLTSASFIDINGNNSMTSIKLGNIENFLSVTMSTVGDPLNPSRSIRIQNCINLVTITINDIFINSTLNGISFNGCNLNSTSIENILFSLNQNYNDSLSNDSKFLDLRNQISLIYDNWSPAAISLKGILEGKGWSILTS
jgi:hypothetical protein